MHSICKFNLCSTHSKWKMTIHCIGIPEPASDCESLLSSDLEFELQVASESESLLRISELFWKHSGVLYSHSCWLLSMALTWLCDVSWKSMHIVYKCNYTCYIYVIIIHVLQTVTASIWNIYKFLNQTLVYKALSMNMCHNAG